jgi:hypothetical protein
LSLVRDMRDDPGHEVQALHSLHLFGSFPLPVTHLSPLFIQAEAL